MDSFVGLGSRVLASVILAGVLTTPSVAFDVLSDEELDTIGAGGYTFSSQSPEERLQPLPDKELDQVHAAAFPTFVWPFQYARSGIVTLLRTVQASDGKGGTVPIGIYRGEQFRSAPPPQQ